MPAIRADGAGMGVLSDSNRAVQFQKAFFENPDLMIRFVAGIKDTSRGMDGQSSQKNGRLLARGLHGFFQFSPAVGITENIDQPAVASADIESFSIRTKCEAVEYFLKRNELTVVPCIQTDQIDPCLIVTGANSYNRFAVGSHHHF